jgi:hypothetical protein
MIAVRHRTTALLSSVLALATATVALPAPARAAVDGFDVTITEVPDEFTAGAGARTVTVVASTDGNRRCLKVRWSMLLRVDGLDLDQVRVDRVEDDGSFPLQVRTDGDTARLTDVRLDPGRLCADRTVTARYRVAVDDDAPDGRVTFRVQAFDATTRLLQEAGASSRVIGEGAKPAPSSPSPSPSESEDAGDGAVVDEEESAEPAPAPAATGDDDLAADRTASEGGVPSLLGPGLIVGAVLVFLGVGLLLRLRMRNRARRPHQGHYYSVQ